MTEIEYLLQDIEKLRKKLVDLIADQEANLQSPEIISASRSLNAAITKYNEIITKNMGK